MNKGKNKTLKTLKEEAELSLKDEDYSSSLKLCTKIKEKYPKNYYGYLGIIKSKTHNYKKYIQEDELKEVKKDYESLIDLVKKDDKQLIKREFDEYVNDCMEVENLKKIRKDLVSKFFLKSLYNDGILFLNQNINASTSYNLNGKRITNLYDLIKGIFWLTCLIFNLIHRNQLLIITIPFGIFGLITIYSFFNMNFIKKGNLRSERKHINKIIKEAKNKILNIKQEIVKLDENIDFLNEQKSNTILKIPETFINDNKFLIENNEKEIANNIQNELSSNNISSFTYLISEETSLNVDDVFSKIIPQINDENDELSKYLSGKLNEKKNIQNKLIFMKKIKPYNYVILVILLIISIFSFIVIANNLYELNIKSFVFGCATGVLSILIHNVSSGKHNSLIDTFNDNLLSTIFNSTLVYDLVYMSITNELKFTYGFVEIPIIFILIFVGFVMLISLFKYKYLLKKSRG